MQNRADLVERHCPPAISVVLFGAKEKLWRTVLERPDKNALFVVGKYWRADWSDHTEVQKNG